ncbi:hypothetical protein DEMA109039_04335 [Deinococcus marmoris]
MSIPSALNTDTACPRYTVFQVAMIATSRVMSLLQWSLARVLLRQTLAGSHIAPYTYAIDEAFLPKLFHHSN